ncbi:MAG: PilN domain-containing protein [Gemmatimonadales bacterium]|nr:PilN domain-containing protein [Gemmatimonadales bacterium]
MITINLRPGVKRQAARRAAFGDIRTQFTSLREGIKEPWLAAAVGSAVLVVLFLGITWAYTASQRALLKPQLVEARAEHERYLDFIRQKRREERVRDSILGQIGTIASVDEERYVWPHILDEIAGAMPGYTWLTEVRSVGAIAAVDHDSTGIGPVVVRIVGRTSDLQNLTSFLRQLEASPWLMNVVPVEAGTVVEGNRALNTFIIQATYVRADSLQIQTVPVLESVVR